MRLTDVAIHNLKAPAKGQKTYFDDALSGFGIRVSQGGIKSFVLISGRSRTRTTLGRYPVISLAGARNKARELLAQKALGKHEAPSMTFEAALDVFLPAISARNRPGTEKNTTRLLKRHFLPPLRHEKLSQVTSQRLAKIIDRLWGTPSEASHAFAAIRLFFNWAVRHELVPKSPCSALQAPVLAASRERVLTDEELKQLLAWANSESSTFSTLIRLLILTGQRRGEIVALAGEMVDLDAATITLPATLTKNGRQHTFPVGPVAGAILKTHRRDGLLFRGRGTDKPFDGWSKSKSALDRECPLAPWTIHDLRRTFATRLAALGTPIHVTEKLLNHVSGTISGVAAIYNRHAYMDEMRHAIEAYEGHLATLTGS
jgi:integrase